VPAAAGLAAIVGHIYPVWLRFRGGKGVATACGVFTVLSPLAVPPALAMFAAAVWLTKYISLGSVVASIALPPLAYALGSPAPTVLAAVAAAIIIVFRHRSNVGRLRTGTERRLERERTRRVTVLAQAAGDGARGPPGPRSGTGASGRAIARSSTTCWRAARAIYLPDIPLPDTVVVDGLGEALAGPTWCGDPRTAAAG
jgi:hypothetical protein